jgi:hypothetical protein
MRRRAIVLSVFIRVLCAYFFFSVFAHESRSDTDRLNTGAPGFESIASATK